MKTLLTELSDRTALYVEDEVLIGLDGEMILKNLGFKRVTLVHDLDSALDHIEAETVDVAVLDINLGDGRTSLTLASDLLANGVRVIFASGYNRSEHSAANHNVPFVNKPFDALTIAAAISEAFDIPAKR